MTKNDDDSKDPFTDKDAEIGNTATLYVTFTIAELERMLKNAEAGGTSEVIIEVTPKLVLR